MAVDNKQLKLNLEELRSRIEALGYDDVPNKDVDLETVNEDDTVWTIDKILERAFNPTIFQLNESQDYEPIGLVVVYEEISNERFFELLDIYKSDNPNYDVDGFVEFLQENHDLEAEKVTPTEVSF